MRSHYYIRRLLTGFLATAAASLALPSARAAQGNEEVPAQQQKRLEAMHAKGLEASLTIFPAVLWDTNKAKDVGGIGKDIANVVGLLLEKVGMANLETTDSVFMLPAEVGFDQAAELFGEFVRNNPIKTDYALYTEFVGRTGPPRIDEVRAVVVDKAGECVWVDRQTPDDPDFKRVKPDCPMGCCVLLTERVRTQLGIPESARDDTGEGKFANLWARKSGLPDNTEQVAMEQRLAIMKKVRPAARVAVFPILLFGDEVSKEGATHLAKLLGEQGLCEARALDTPLHIELQRTRNEQKALWDLARAFRDHVRKNPFDADYALYADYMISPRAAHVMGVHFVVCDQTGEWVIVDFQNSHHGDFQSIDPKTIEDCGRLVAKRLEGYLR